MFWCARIAPKSPEHPRYAEWLRALMNGAEPFGLSELGGSGFEPDPRTPDWPGAPVGRAARDAVAEPAIKTVVWRTMASINKVVFMG